MTAIVIGALAACSSSGGEETRHPDTVEERAAALQCAELDQARPQYANLAGDVVVDCLVEHRWPARLHDGLTPEERPALLRLLASGGGIAAEANGAGCRNGAPRDHAVAAGDDWVVVVSEAAGADEVARLLGGEVVSPGEGPPASYPMVDCTRTPR